MKGLLANGEVFGGRMESGLMGSGLVRNKPSQNVFESIEYLSKDSYLNNPILYLKGDGLDNSTTIIDSSETPYTINRNNALIKIAQSKYGGSSIYFNNNNLIQSNSHYLLINSYSILKPIYNGNHKFTIDLWVYISLNNSGLATPIVLFNSSWAVYPDIRLQFDSNRTVYFRFTGDGSSIELLSINSLSLYSWNLISITFDLDKYRLFINGNLEAEAEKLNSYLNTDSPSPMVIGAAGAGSNGLLVSYPRYGFTGYLDSFRIVIDSCLQTANFNPETDTYLNY